MISLESKYVSTKINFILSNGTSFELNTSSNNYKYNYITLLKISEAISAENDLPIGVNTGNVLDLEITSDDKMLIPENEASIYYGYMDKSAKLEVTVSTDTKSYFLGRYFVDSWKSSITSDTPNSVVISATNVMSYISKMETPDASINNTEDIKNYLIEIIEKINSSLDVEDKIKVNENNLFFKAFPLMYYPNLPIDNMSNTLNSLSQCTLTNIFTDRENNLCTDYNCDDSFAEAEYELNVLTSAECGTGNLVNYDGVKVNYSNGNIKDVEQLSGVSDQDISAGDNKIENISLGENVYKINRIECIPEDVGVFIGIKSATYNKSRMSLMLDCSDYTSTSINVYGQRMDDTELVRETGGNNKLELNNKVLNKEYIPKYVDNLYALMSIKNNSIQVSGYFTPELTLSQIVYVNAVGAMNVSGYYKVVSIDWDISAYCEATVKLIKTFTMPYNVNTLTDRLNELLEKRLKGYSVSSESFVSLTDSENNSVNNELSDPLTELRTKLYGGN